MDFDYKKYSLERLEEWVNDALLSSEASPQEIYDVIKKATEENYHYFKHHTGRCYELLALLNGNGKGHFPAYDEYVDKKENLVCDKDDLSPECKKSWNDFWKVGEESHYPEEVKDNGVRHCGHNDMKALRYTDEELDAMCDAAEAKNKVKTWVVPVDDDYNITFPEDLLEQINWKAGDAIEWHNQGDGSFKLIKKENHPSWVKGNELARVKTYQEMIDDGWSTTGDGFWIKEN